MAPTGPASVAERRDTHLFGYHPPKSTRGRWQHRSTCRMVSRPDSAKYSIAGHGKIVEQQARLQQVQRVEALTKAGHYEREPIPCVCDISTVAPQPSEVDCGAQFLEKRVLSRRTPIRRVDRCDWWNGRPLTGRLSASLLISRPSARTSETGGNGVRFWYALMLVQCVQISRG